MIENKFSIIIPAYNASKTIQKCLDRLVNQQYINFEIIIVDDGSTDDTLSICVEYSRNNNIKVIHQSNKGPGSARFNAFQYITGDYVLFCDADDYFENNTLILLNQLIEKNDRPDIIEFGYKMCDETGTITYNEFSRENNKQEKEQFLNELIIEKRCSCMLVTHTFNVRLFSNIIETPWYHREDGALALQLYFNANSKLIVSNLFYSYIMTKKSLCRNSYSIKDNDSVHAYEFMYHYVKEKNNNRYCDFISYSICSAAALNYISLKNSKIKNANILCEDMLGTFKMYYKKIESIRNVKKQSSKNRNILITIFSISPFIARFTYKIFCKESIKNNQVITILSKK